MCVSDPADHAAVTCYKPNEVFGAQEWDGWDSNPAPASPSSRARPPPLGQTGQQAPELIVEQNTRSELGGSDQACSFKLNNLLRCFLLIRHNVFVNLIHGVIAVSWFSESRREMAFRHGFHLCFYWLQNPKDEMLLNITFFPCNIAKFQEQPGGFPEKVGKCA